MDATGICQIWPSPLNDVCVRELTPVTVVPGIPDAPVCCCSSTVAVPGAIICILCVDILQQLFTVTLPELNQDLVVFVVLAVVNSLYLWRHVRRKDNCDRHFDCLHDNNLNPT
jgi:hypothetical protein